MKFVLALVLLGACSNLEPIDARVCGNGVVEAGEDCDSPDDRCSDCSVVCVDESSCGAEYDALGFVCGLDGLCHAGTGELGAPVSTLATVETFAVTPLDDDPIGDVLVQTPTGVQALYGVGDGSLLADAAQLSATPTGPAIFADLDGDRRLDVLLPTPDGIAAFTSPFGGPASQAFPAVIGPELGIPTFGQAADEDFGVFLGDMAGKLVLVVFDGSGSGLVPLGQICMADAVRLDPSTVATFKVEPRHVVIAVGLTRQDGSYEPCVVDVRPPPPPMMPPPEPLPPFVQTEIEVPGGRVLSRPLLVKSFSNDGGTRCPTLVAQTVDDQQRTVVSSLQLAYDLEGPCAAAPPIESALSPPDAGTLVAAVQLDVAANALVFERQMYTYRFLVVGSAQGNISIEEEPFYTSDRDIVSVRSIDLDRDGLVDLVTRSANGAMPVEDLDILTQFKLFGDLRGFLRLRYDTLGPVSDTTIGDYDGDRWSDIAFVQTLTDGQVAADELAIAFGSPSGFGPRTTMGLFEQVRSLIGIGFRDSIDPFGRVSDLAVLYRSCADCPVPIDQVSQLHGSPQRTLIGYYDPRPPASAIKGPFGAVVLGNFVDTDAEPDPTLDLIAVEHEMTCTAPSSSEPAECSVIPQLRLWINDGALDGDVGETEPITTPKAFPYTIPGQYLALPRSAQEPDLVIGTNVYGHGITFDPASSDLPVLWSSGVDTATVGATLKRAELIRVTEGDALVTKLLLSYGSTGSGNPVVRVCSLDDPFHPDCQPVMHGFACVDGAVLRMGTGGEQVSRLIALCREGSVGDATGVLVEVDTSVMPFTTTPLRMPKGDANGNLIRTGDVTGDAIDDVLVLDRVQGLAEIRVYPQCNTRDTRCGEQP